MEDEVTTNSSSKVVDNATQVTATEVKVSTDVHSYGENGDFLGASHEEHKQEVTTVEEIPDEVADTEDIITENSTKKDDEPNKVDNTATVLNELEDLKQRCSTLESAFADKTAAYDLLLQKCSDLEAYKFNTESKLAKNAIECALNSVSHILNSEQMKEWRTESAKSSIGNVDEFINKLKAFAFDVQDKNDVIQIDNIRNSIPKEVENETTDMWGRLTKKYI